MIFGRLLMAHLRKPVRPSGGPERLEALKEAGCETRQQKKEIALGESTKIPSEKDPLTRVRKGWTPGSRALRYREFR